MLTIFKRRADTGSTAAAATEPSDAVQAARTRARRRLIGAAVLVAIGVIGFPLVFETQPRPIPVDIPIELPRKDTAPPLTMPAARAPVATTSASGIVATAPSESRPAAPSSKDIITESRDGAAGDAGPATAVAPVPPVDSMASRPAGRPAPVAAAEAERSKPTPEPVKTAAPAADSARAKALLEGKPTPTPAAAEKGRYVVQVGAFADPGAARETRLKVEKLGLKTYTQVASTAAGDRIRVRVGPFATRDEADRALAKARGAGLSAVVLTL